MNKYILTVIIALLFPFFSFDNTAYAGDQASTEAQTATSVDTPRVRFSVENDPLTGTHYIRGILYLPKKHTNDGDYYAGFWTPVPADLGGENFHWSGLYKGPGCRVVNINDQKVVRGDVSEGNICVLLPEYYDGFENGTSVRVRHQRYACADIQNWIVEGAEVVDGTSIFGYGGGFQKSSPSDKTLQVYDAEDTTTYQILLADRL